MNHGLSLRISITDRCALRCTYCVPASGAPKAPREEVLSYEEIAGFVSVLASRYPIAQVRLTGGEPLLRPKLETLVAMLAEAGAPDLALTTGGQQLAAKARGLKQAGLKRVNISLDTLSPSVFSEITGGGSLKHTLTGIAAAQEAGLDPVKLNTVVLRGQNDHEAADLVQFAMEQGCQIRFLELMPIGTAATEFERRFVPTAEVRARISREFSLAALPVEPESTSRNFRASDGNGRSAVVGFISPYSEPFCGGCWRLRLTATGLLIGCLARPQGIPVAPMLRRTPGPDVEALSAVVEEALGTKRRNHEFAQRRQMVEIGG